MNEPAGGEPRHAAVSGMHGDGERDGVGKVVLDPLEDAVEELAVGALLPGMERRSGHGRCYPLVMTVATRSSPEMPSSVAMWPEGLTIMVSEVPAASEKSARTAALSQ